jgi:hypothetical protein
MATPEVAKRAATLPESPVAEGTSAAERAGTTEAKRTAEIMVTRRRVMTDMLLSLASLRPSDILPNEMNGQREMFSCPSCGRTFTYWVADGNPHPKIKCTFCAKESFPKGEPPAAPAPASAPVSASAPAPAAAAPAPPAKAPPA